MTDYTRREVTTTRVVYSVPAPPDGSGGIAYWDELRKAIYAIERELGGRAGIDDAVRVEAGDDAVLLSFPKPEPELPR